MTQGTDAWRLMRAGHCTASRFSDVLAKIKTGEAATRRAYRWELVTERLIGTAVEGFSNRAMEWGTENEARARLAYEVASGNVVDQVDFIVHPEVPFVGCSPDGLIGTDGGVEIKCPYNSVVHVQTLEGGMPSEHRAQVQGSMWVTGRAWWDFVSYDPRMPRGLELHVERVQRDDDYILALAAEVKAFLEEIVRQESRLRGRMQEVACSA